MENAHILALLQTAQKDFNALIEKAKAQIANPDVTLVLNAWQKRILETAFDLPDRVHSAHYVTEIFNHEARFHVTAYEVGKAVPYATINNAMKRLGQLGLLIYIPTREDDWGGWIRPDHPWIAAKGLHIRPRGNRTYMKDHLEKDWLQRVQGVLISTSLDIRPKPDDPSQPDPERVPMHHTDAPPFKKTRTKRRA